MRKCLSRLYNNSNYIVTNIEDTEFPALKEIDMSKIGFLANGLYRIHVVKKLQHTSLKTISYNLFVIVFSYLLMN